MWDEIRRSVKPLRAESPPPDLTGEFAAPEKASFLPGPKTVSSGKARLPTAAPYYPPVSGKAVAGIRLDDVTMRKLRKGRLTVDSRLDLHGMTQAHAHSMLLHFLDHCAVAGHRIVLIITGKGKTGEGVLRRQVPLWLQEPAFRKLVSGHRHAHMEHGGEGALYVRLRRNGRSR